jgi:hypothetical protein
MPGEAIRLGQILKFCNIRVRVSGEGTKAFFNLRQVCERKGNMNSHDNPWCQPPLGGGRGKPVGWGFCESEYVGDSGEPDVLSW